MSLIPTKGKIITIRKNKKIMEAYSYCNTLNITFYTLNEKYPGETIEGNFSRKNTLHPEGKAFLQQLKNEKVQRDCKINKETKMVILTILLIIEL